MRNINAMLIVLALVGLSFSQTYYNEGRKSSDRSSKVIQLDGGPIAEMLIDVQDDSAGVAYSPAYDLKNVPIKTFGDSGGVQVANLGLGVLTISCYDVDGTSGDSVDYTVLTQISSYGANGFSPHDTYSDAWATLHTTTVNGVSTSSALVEATQVLALSSEATRFVRWKVTNDGGDADDDDQRCRLYWTMKTRK